MRILEAPIDLPGSVGDILQVKAIRALPKEACGVIYTDHRLREYENTCDQPEHGFDMEIDLTDNIDVIWHSHPNGLAWPSRQDAPKMLELAEHGFNFRWLIITATGLHMYKVVNDDAITAA